jgi:Flp pilus assembly protein TadG
MLTRRFAARCRPSAQRGSMTVELVILAPIVIVLMMFLVAAGWVVEARGQADGAARDAARAASIATNPQQALQFANNAVVADQGNGLDCRPLGLGKGGVQGFAPDSATVIVTVHCTLSLTFFSGTWQVTGYAVAPLDPYVART